MPVTLFCRCRKDTYLYSIVVKNRETGFGVPVAFFLTKISQWNIIEGWLKQLKAKMDTLCTQKYEPTVVITDQGNTEINAIRGAFSYKVRIFYCAWHVLQAWERKFTNANLGMGDLPEAGRLQRKALASAIA